MKKKIIVIGAYGCGNKGDDAILEGIISSLQKQYDFCVTNGNYGGVGKKFHVKTLRCRMNEGMTIAVLFNMLLFFPQYLYQCIRSDYVLIGGGSLLHDITKYNLPFFALLQKTAELLRRRVIYIGVGAGPITTNKGRKICCKAIGKAEKVFVRDIPDYKLLKKIGLGNVELTADMAFMTETKRELANGILSEYGLQRKGYIAVTACEWFKSDNFWKKEQMDFSYQKRKLAQILRKMIDSTGLPILFIPTVFHDNKLARKLQEMLPRGKFYVLSDKYDCSHMAALVAESKFLFGIRMHSIIFAIRAGVPFLASAYDKKVDSLVKRCNMSDYVFDFERTELEEIQEMVGLLIKNREEISKYLAEAGKELRKSAEKAVNYMKTLA